MNEAQTYKFTMEFRGTLDNLRGILRGITRDLEEQEDRTVRSVGSNYHMTLTKEVAEEPVQEGVRYVLPPRAPGDEWVTTHETNGLGKVYHTNAGCATFKQVVRSRTVIVLSAEERKKANITDECALCKQMNYYRVVQVKAHSILGNRWLVTCAGVRTRIVSGQMQKAIELGKEIAMQQGLRLGRPVTLEVYRADGTLRSTDRFPRSPGRWGFLDKDI